jgi:hypothetical protein
MCEKTRSTRESLAIKKTPKTTLAQRTERCANLSRQGMPRITQCVAPERRIRGYTIAALRAATLLSSRRPARSRRGSTSWMK